MLRTCHVLTILTSKSFSRAGVVRILRRSTSKSAPTPPVFNDFDFQIALARRAWCEFCEAQLPKVLRHRQFLTILTSKSLSRAGRGANFEKLNFQKCSAPATILTSKSLSRAGVVQILSTSWAADPSHHQCFAQFLPAKISPVTHLCCQTSLLSNIDAARPTGNFQYSRILELLNFL